MSKSQGAFRTISEVSEWLDTPAHVLRFWESKFSQIKPVKRAGGRRYYRPEDMALLGGIKALLHDQGLTIKGVQKLLRDQGNRHVMAMGPLGLPDASEPGPADHQDDQVLTPRPSPVRKPVQTQTAPRSIPATPELGAEKLAPAAPAFLRSLASIDRHPNSARAARIAPLLERLTMVADRMARV